MFNLKAAVYNLLHRTPNLSLYCRLTVTDKNGKVVSDTGNRVSRSFVLQFLALIEMCSAVGNCTAINTSGSTVTVSSSTTTPINVNASAGTVTNGIVAGTGNTAATNTDYVLETPIAHGTGAGQLSYGGTSYTLTQVIGANVDFSVIRALLNNSGNPITVNEVAIYASGATNGPYCIARDVVAGGQSIANGQTLTVQYTFRTTV